MRAKVVQLHALASPLPPVYNRIMKTVVVIPSFNEESTLPHVLEQVVPAVDEVIVVDDGSWDGTSRVARAGRAFLVRHEINRGLGATLGTGFAAALRRGADVVICLDADGQHDPSDIPRFVQALDEGADVVIGSRLLDPSGMPVRRQIANWVGNVVTFVLFGKWVTDSQSGYRAFRRQALERIQIKSNRMEVSSEIIAESRRHGLKLVEIPIKAVYTEYSLSKGQSFRVGLKTLAKLILRRLMPKP
jgi:glycosyltransferase involved in cell wall biosynthesis